MNNYYRADGWVKTVLGPAVPGAQIYVCIQPANVFPPVTPPRTTPVPWAGPNPQALIYSDAGFTPIVQPIITDGFGHYDFYALPGLYTVVVLFNGAVQQFYIDQSLGNVGTSLGTSLQLLTNGSPNFNQSVQNLVQGAGMIISTDNLGNTTFTSSGGAGGPVLETNGVVNPIQDLQNLKNGADIGIVSDGAGGVTVSSTARGSLPQPDAARFSMWQVAYEIPGGVSNPWVIVSESTLSDSLGGGGGVISANYISPTTTNGAAVQISAGYVVGVSYSGGQVYLPANTVTFKTTFQTFADPSDIDCAAVIQIGVSNVVANITNRPTSGDCAVLSVNKAQGGSFSNLLFVCSRSGVSTTVDTGIPASDATGLIGIRYEIEIQVSVGSAELYVNGVLSATIVLTLPLSPVGPSVFVVNSPNPGGPQGTLLTNIEYVYVESPTP